ncbi:MAG: BMC domain-containing protein, partial [Ignavibacterium sp.]|nr:BMC domain-containing protein [Ignavibacterium sp.]
MSNSIGLIESKGLVALVEAADVISKNSPVKILGVHKLVNGLVTLAVSGNTDYVNAAIESGAEAGRRVGEIYSFSVVDNPNEVLLEIFSELFPANTNIKAAVDKKLDVQQSGREINEALIHDVLFQQGDNNPENSDLWIINEDFIYFKGSSNIVLSQVEIEGEKLFKEEFTAEEEKYLRSLGENRKIKKPDVLLFPEEGKCIIIEFKAPDVNVSDHLT